MGISDIFKKKDAKKSVKKDAKKVTEKKEAKKSEEKKDAKKVTEKKEAKKSEEKKDAKKVTEKKETKKTVEKKETKKTASNKTANKNNFKDPFEGLMVKIEPGMYRQPIRESAGLVYPNGDKRRKPQTSWREAEKLVTIEKGFKICKYLVTQKQWNQIMGEETNNSKYKGDDRPVNDCTMLSIANFIQKLNSLTGKKYRLPTIEEWRWAALGAQKNNDRSYFAGAQERSELRDYAYLYSEAEKFEVGNKKPNEIGLYDMQAPRSTVISDLILRKDKEIPYYRYYTIGCVVSDQYGHYAELLDPSSEDFCKQTIFWPGELYEIKFDEISGCYIRLALDED